MMIIEKEALTFDDVLLVPQHSDLESRKQADSSTRIGALELKIPIVSANMDSITGLKMAVALGETGGAGILHRFEKDETLLWWVQELQSQGLPAIPSVGVKAADTVLAKKYRYYTEHICLDIAHGDSLQAVEMVKVLKSLDFKTIIAGNVATLQGAHRLVKAGANVIKVGIGPGSVCQTRGITGHGLPQLQAILDVCSEKHRFYIDNSYTSFQVIADGGMRNSGDIVKALGAGAHCVMTGSLFAGCAETPVTGPQNTYRGMASKEAQESFRGHVSNGTPEGISMNVPMKGSAKEVLETLAGGIRSGLSYSGCRTLKEFRENAIFVRVTANCKTENGTRQP